MPKYTLKPGTKHYLMQPVGKQNKLVKVEGGQTIELSEEAAKGIKDKLVQVPLVDAEVAAKVQTQINNSPKIVETDVKGLYNVINQTTGKPINAAPVKLAEAEEIAGHAFDG